MSYLDEWAQVIAKQLKSEAELVGTQAKSELYEDAARDTFVRVVLEPFLPGSYAVGSGRVIDSSGNISSAQDIVIYRRDYPQFNMPGSYNVFIYESVLATIQVCSKLVRKSFFNALDDCVSMGTLSPSIEPATLRAMASKMNMVSNALQQYVHPDPLHTGRFNLIGRPQCFVYAFTGYQTSDRQLTENLVKWIDHYHQNDDTLEMKSLPSVIATQGCFAWRNTAPFAIKSKFLMGVGIDHAPLRLIFLQLMHALNRRLQNTSEGYGIKASIAPYLAGFEPPAISDLVGKALNPGDKKPAGTTSLSRDQVAAKKQTPAPDAVQAAPIKQSEEKGERIAQLAVSDKQGVDARKARSSTAGTSVSHGGDKTSVAKASSSEEAPAHIENSASQPAHSDDLRAQSSPHSMSSHVPENKVEKAPFKPAEKALSQADEKVAEKASETDTGGNLSTQEMDTLEDRKARNNEAGLAQRGNFRSPPEAHEDEGEDMDDGFIDTLVETAESLAQDTSRSSSEKHNYVTESLI
jgi:hypothetical protein